MRILTIILITFSALILVNCTKNEESTLLSQSKLLTQNNNLLLPIPQTPDSIYLYHLFDKYLLTYNTKTFESEQPFDIFEQSFFYDFNFFPSNLYTAGDSEKYHYQILRVSNNQINPIYSPKNPEKTALFPVARNENLSFFTESQYDDEGSAFKHDLLILEKDEIRRISQEFGAIHSGVLQENTLFYTVFESELDQYDLYAYDLQENSAPKKIEEGLVYPYLYLHNGKIYRSNKEKIYSDDNAFTYHPVSKFIDRYQILIQIYQGEYNQRFLEITDTQNKNILYTVADPINYAFDEDELIIYCEGSIETIPLKDLKN